MSSTIIEAVGADPLETEDIDEDITVLENMKIFHLQQ